MSQVEVWLRGALADVPALLMPAAHALLQTSEDIEIANTLQPAELWLEPAGAASVGFHLRHLSGSSDRLLSYAKGQNLSQAQLEFLRSEKEPGNPPLGSEQLIAEARQTFERVLETIRSTPEEKLLEPREVGRAKLPSTLLGLLFHIAEHSQRHAGQIVTTVKMIQGFRTKT